MERPFDIVIFGATGFTGSLAVEYLARNSIKGGKYAGVKWAVAGRNQTKLKQSLAKVQATLRSEMKDDTISLEAVPIITADSADLASLEDMCKRTKVVLSAVGPFTLYGSLLVQACVQQGCHYADTTGETFWVRDMITQHHQKAVDNGVLIVPQCGYDSIPSDLGVMFAVDTLKKNHPEVKVQGVKGIMQTNGSASGGTLSTALVIIEAVSNNYKKMVPLLKDKYLLNPEGTKPAKVPASDSETETVYPTYWKEFKKWTCPFFLCPSNATVVRRSNGLRSVENKDNGYGDSFGYSERLATGFWMCLMMCIIWPIFILLGFFRPTRWLLRKFLPAPGEGPSAARRAKSKFKLTFCAKGKMPNGEEVSEYVNISGGDPGYTETAKMLVECGLALATQRQALAKGGVLTPSTAFGPVLVDRLNASGIPLQHGL